MNIGVNSSIPGGGSASRARLSGSLSGHADLAAPRARLRPRLGLCHVGRQPQTAS
jgi:hypothetical protein